MSKEYYITFMRTDTIKVNISFSVEPPDKDTGLMFPTLTDIELELVSGDNEVPIDIKDLENLTGKKDDEIQEYIESIVFSATVDEMES